MGSQIRRVVRNFIWGGKATNVRAKVKWDTFTLSMGIIDPKAQSEALLAKLLVRGLAPGGEPWKELLRHRVDQTQLSLHDGGPQVPNINWIFTAPKLKRPPPYSFWKSIYRAWINAKEGLTKADPTSLAEILRQPLFGNPLVTNTDGLPLGVNGQNERDTFARLRCTKIKDL